MRKKKKIIIITISVLLVVGLTSFGIYQYSRGKDSKNPPKQDKETEVEKVSSSYEMKGNSIEDFDLYFMKEEDKEKNVIYSPLSIKYALAMLSEGASELSKAQIDAVIGKYQAKKYNNNSHMSFANALFINSNFENAIKKDYIVTLKNKFNAEIQYDTFLTPDNINEWVSGKTFHLIKDLFDDVSEKSFILINALGIDMEWKYVVQPAPGHELYDKEHTMFETDFYVDYLHEKYGQYISELDSNWGFYTLDFNKKKSKVKALEIGASINNYDIVSALGEASIRKTVGEAYDIWLGEHEDCEDCEEFEEKNVVLDRYIKELNSSYKDVASSTDFRFYVDDYVKVFAKELKEYEGTTLEYIGIMPKKETLSEYIKKIKASDIEVLLNNLKTIELDNFSKGKITQITGYIPIFKFDYKLDLVEGLKRIGITDVFDVSKANLKNITDEGIFIDSASHKANIEFSNEGIKAAAATEVGGAGNDSDYFEYLYDVPVETIDLTFDNPYMFLIRDKDTKEVWFTGNVYEPTIEDRDYR